MRGGRGLQSAGFRAHPPARGWRVAASPQRGADEPEDEILLRILQRQFGRQQIALLGRALRPGGSGARDVLFAAIRRRLGGALRAAPPPPVPEAINDEDRRILRALHARGDSPATSALIFCDRSAGAADLDRALAAARAQIVPFETIVLAVREGSPLAARAAALAQGTPDVVSSLQDSRFPTGACVILDASVTLRPEAGAVLAATMGVADAELVYADHALRAPDGSCGEPFHKPVYSPRLAEGSHYMGPCALVAVRAGTTAAALAGEIEAAGGVAPFITRRAAASGTDKVHRAPFVLFEERAARQAALLPPAPRAPAPSAANAPTVAIIIPTRNQLALLRPCIASVLARTDYPREAISIIVVDNGSSDEPTLRYLREGEASGSFAVMRDAGAFNYARLNNRAVRRTEAEILVLLNNDTLITQPDWLARMVEAAAQEGVGAVGAKLLYRDDTVQHGGVILGIQGVAAHADVNIAADAPGYHGLAWHDREVSAVTAACLATRRAVFEAVGGFDETLAVAFNDTLLCIRMLEAGYTNLQLNSVRVTHLESKSRGHDEAPEKRARFLQETLHARREGNGFFLDDPFYSPRLSLRSPYQAAAVPRHRKPWRAPRFSPVPSVLLLADMQDEGVAAAVRDQATALAAGGFTVHVGGMGGPTDGWGQTVLRLPDPLHAAAFAAAQDIDVVIAHTPPFHSVVRWAGARPIVLCVDHATQPRDEETAFAFAAARRVLRPDEPADSLAGDLIALWQES
ncbi:glycosyltransferase family 2 protein [Aureimonas mangrovi]|uniref:glycosyltransferase family 2 protein n=1 Tax=Aureimonas mangrovi TaxID=2758041 RepID=UPI00163D9FB7|nr:glycosyltransferase family 2 protein [Aureimonas mangrovi]